MLKLSRELIDKINTAEAVSDLYFFLQNAIILEHATIPCYLSGLYSLKDGTNQAVAQILRTVVIEEMLHVTIAANVLNAIGGSVVFNTPASVPPYPTPLPMNINPSLSVTLGSVTKEQVQKVYMGIETPSHIIDIPGGDASYLCDMCSPVSIVPSDTTVFEWQALMVVAEQKRAKAGYATIGDFYNAIMLRLTALVARDGQDKVFIGDPRKQVTANGWFRNGELRAVTGLASALEQMQMLKVQGEGSSSSPMEYPGEPAHYYRFAQILRGKALVPDSSTAAGYSYSGDPVVLDEANVITYTQLPPSQYNELATQRWQQVNYTYTTLLNTMNSTFNGSPDDFKFVMGLMYELRLVVEQLVEVQQADGGFAMPTFEFAAVD